MAITGNLFDKTCQSDAKNSHFQNKKPKLPVPFKIKELLLGENVAMF
jgi:hypothetical protein